MISEQTAYNLVCFVSTTILVTILICVWFLLTRKNLKFRNKNPLIRELLVYFDSLNIRFSAINLLGRKEQNKKKSVLCSWIRNKMSSGHWNLCVSSNSNSQLHLDCVAANYLFNMPFIRMHRFHSFCLCMEFQWCTTIENWASLVALVHKSTFGRNEKQTKSNPMT